MSGLWEGTGSGFTARYMFSVEAGGRDKSTQQPVRGFVFVLRREDSLIPLNRWLVLVEGRRRRRRRRRAAQVSMPPDQIQIDSLIDPSFFCDICFLHLARRRTHLPPPTSLYQHLLHTRPPSTSSLGAGFPHCPLEELYVLKGDGRLLPQRRESND